MTDVKETILFVATLAGVVTLTVTGHWCLGLLLLLIL
jgi:hypothetical protein